MPQPRKRDWTYEESIFDTAAELMVPYTRLYNMLSAMGLKQISNENELQRVALALLRDGGISHEGLIKVFGPQMTLGQLGRLAEGLEAVVSP